MNLKEVKMVVIDDKIYLLSNETNNKHFVFSIGGNLTIGEFDDLLGDEIDWVMNKLNTRILVGVNDFLGAITAQSCTPSPTGLTG